MIKESIQKEDIIIINIYVPKNRAAKHVSINWQSWREKDNSTVVGDSKTLFFIAYITIRRYIHTRIGMTAKAQGWKKITGLH